MAALRRLMPILFLLLILFPGSLLRAEDSAFSMTNTTSDGVWDAIRKSESKAVLVNFWATWCQPCREEMPDLLKLRETYHDKGFSLLLVSADFTRSRQQAVDYLAGLGVDYPTLLKNQKDMEFIEGIHQDWNGALPFSMLVNGEGDVVRTWEGKASFDELEAELLPLLHIETTTKQKRDS